MGIVRRHKRRTASGKMATVRQHHRNTGDSARDAWAARVAAANAPSNALRVGSPELAAQAPPPTEDWWDGDEDVPAGDFWAADSEGTAVEVPDFDSAEDAERFLREQGFEPLPDDVGTPAAQERRAAQRGEGTAVEVPDFDSAEDAERFLREQGFEPLPDDVGTPAAGAHRGGMSHD